MPKAINDPGLFAKIRALMETAEADMPETGRGAERKAKVSAQVVALAFMPGWVPKPMRRMIAMFLVQVVWDLGEEAKAAIEAGIAKGRAKKAEADPEPPKPRRRTKRKPKGGDSGT